VLLALAGFIVFVQALERREPPVAPKADAIVALTGGSRADRRCRGTA
jgi:hypothetical protein